MWITDGLYLTYEQALNNANIVFNFFKDKGYTKEAICGSLGNMWRESHVNPTLNQGMVVSNHLYHRHSWRKHLLNNQYPVNKNRRRNA